MARRRIKRYLIEDPELEIIGECSNGSEAVEAINSLKPDLIFIDVQMPEKDGFGVLEALKPENVPTIIFVTAHDKFAIRAFEYNAFDFLLKPFSVERLKKTVERAKEEIKRKENAPTGERLLTLLSELKEENNYLKRITVKEKGKIIFVSTENIESIEAQGNYLELNELNVGQNSHLIRMRLHHLENKLDRQKFVRIHRSTIINIDRVKEMQPLFNGDQTVIMQSGKKLTMSRNYREKLKLILEDF